MSLIKKIIPAGLFLVGIVFFLFGIFGITSQPKGDLEFTQPPVFVVEAETVKEPIEPLEIKIPELGIQAKIEKSWIVDGQWGISKTSASYLANSGKMGEIGNAIFYAHNTKPLFKNLVKAQVGQTVIVITDKGKDVSYTIKSIKVVSPKEVSILEQGDKQEITLYTCTGFNNSERFVVKAEPVG